MAAGPHRPPPSEGDPAEIVEIAGPHEEDLAQLATMLVARRGTPVKVQVVRGPGGIA